MDIPFIRRTAMVFHAGFMTYALIFLVVLIAIYFIAPPLFEEITRAIRELGRAIRGEDIISSFI